MTIRNTIRAVAFAAALGALAAPALAAQEYELPRSLSYLQLPADPIEFVRRMTAGEWMPLILLKVGCPSEGGWAGAAFAALEKAAETDARAFAALADLWSTEHRFARRQELGHPTAGPQCPSDFPRERADVWLAGQLRREWERGLLTPGPDRSVAIFNAMVWATAPEAFEVVRGIARDPAVDGLLREWAAYTLHKMYFGEGGRRDSPQPDDPARWERYLAAEKAVLLDLAAGSPLPEYERELFSKVKDDDAFRLEYERALRAAGREIFW